MLRYSEVTADGREAVFAVVEPTTPPVEALAAYAGSYVFPDLRVRYTLVVRDGRLVVRRRMEDLVLDPTVDDAFNAGAFFDIVFVRDGRGDVSGFDIFSERIRHLRFYRDA
ncbi:hypothetical protein [Sphaerobacter thermophilus]|uniref:Uncharacterized protein n=1 Tax=Sphaerobacter thermophilus (strain ATCC 49802 / DSM 20745 / KCCM 41009 / NCIMB 13125 / S 6022) TaxID=479434 RepID=D1C933_SPHTD|nr:hypothetical protein [Sphaerobacter thermophilus]ACZ40326.1 hypothetical protein Sthe_2919 [Sphaerobacter thermophilus DSM 20745]